MIGYSNFTYFLGILPTVNHTLLIIGYTTEKILQRNSFETTEYNFMNIYC